MVERDEEQHTYETNMGEVSEHHGNRRLLFTNEELQQHMERYYHDVDPEWRQMYTRHLMDVTWRQYYFVDPAWARRAITENAHYHKTKMAPRAG